MRLWGSNKPHIPHQTWRIKSREDHRIIEIIESFGLEGTPRGHLVQSPRSE